MHSRVIKRPEMITYHTIVDASLLQQGGVSPSLEHLAISQNEYHVGILDGGEPVSYYNHGPTLLRSLKDGLNHLLRFRI